MGFAEKWKYRIPHKVKGTTVGAQTNYPIKIIAHYGNGENSGQDLYLNGECKSDFGDLRFEDSSGILPYWIERKENGDYAEIWVAISNIPVYPQSTTLYVYFSNDEAESISSQMDVKIWQLKEDMWTSTFPPDVTFTKPDPSQLRGYNAGWNHIGAAIAFMEFPSDWFENKWVRLKWSGYNSNPTSKNLLAKFEIYDGTYDRALASDFPTNIANPIYKGAGILGRPLEEYQQFPFVVERDVQMKYIWGPSQLEKVSLFVYMPWDVSASYYHRVELWWIEINSEASGVGNLFIDDMTYQPVMEVTDTWQDYGLFRNYVDPEPSHDEWGEIERLIPVGTILSKARILSTEFQGSIKKKKFKSKIVLKKYDGLVVGL